MEPMLMQRPSPSRPAIKCRAVCRSWRLLLLCLTILPAGGCGLENDQEAVDEAYLQSAHYEQFREKTRNERENTLLQREEFIVFIESKKCDDQQANRSRTVRIDSLDFEQAFANERVRSVDRTAFWGEDKTYHRLAEIQSDDSCLSFFLTCNVAFYRDCMVWYAVQEDDELRHLQQLTAYKKTHTYAVQPKIVLDHDRLCILQRYKTMYPLETSHQTRRSYRLMEDKRLSPNH